MDSMFLFVGCYTAQEGCDILIEAIPAILQNRGDVRFVIVGDGRLEAHSTPPVRDRAPSVRPGHTIVAVSDYDPKVETIGREIENVPTPGQSSTEYDPWVSERRRWRRSSRRRGTRRLRRPQEGGGCRPEGRRRALAILAEAEEWLEGHGSRGRSECS